MQIGPEMEDLAFTPLVEMVIYNTPLHSNNSGNDNGTANGNGINNK